MDSVIFYPNDLLVSSCSFHGKVVNGKCICDEGWTGIGDFNPVDGLDCGISLAILDALSYISILFGTVAMLQYLFFIISRLRSRSKFAKKDQFALSYFIQTLTCNIFAALLLIYPEDTVFGSSIIPTILMWIAYLTAYGGTVVFFEAVMELLVGITKVMSIVAQRKMKDSIERIRPWLKHMYLLCFICSLNGLTGLLVPPKNCKITGIIWFYSWVIFMILFMLMFNPPVNILRSELTIATKVLTNSNQSLVSIKFNITIVQVAINLVFVITTVMFTLWASIDSLMRLAVYCTLYCTIGVHIFSIPMLIALTYQSKGARISVTIQPIGGNQQEKIQTDGARVSFIDQLLGRRTGTEGQDTRDVLPTDGARVSVISQPIGHINNDANQQETREVVRTDV